MYKHVRFTYNTLNGIDSHRQNYPAVHCKTKQNKYTFIFVIRKTDEKKNKQLYTHTKYNTHC